MRSMIWGGGWGSALVLTLAACVDRTVEPEIDYTEEVIRICEGLCAIDLACVETPPMTYDECVEICEAPGTTLYQDSECGEAFRAFYGCVADIQGCDVWATADEERCGEEYAIKSALKCGSQGQGE